MKTIFLILGLTLTLQTHAFQFRANAQIYFDRVYGEARVYNGLNTPILCDGNAVGLTSTGRQVFSYMNNVRILPGMFAYLSVYTNNYEPFIGVTPNIFCQTQPGTFW